MNRQQLSGGALRLRTLALASLMVFAGGSLSCSGSSTTSPANPSSASFASGATAPTGPTGSYDLTLTASASCGVVPDSATGQSVPFPDVVKVRRYAAEFADGNATLTSSDPVATTVRIGGIDRYDIPNQTLMTLQAGTLTITVPGNTDPRAAECAGGDFWWEQLSDAPGAGEFFESCGIWRAHVDNLARIQGTVSGKLIYYKGVGPKFTNQLMCSATDHQFTMTLR